MKRKTIIMMTAMIICSLLSFGCSKKANITVEGGSATPESVEIGDIIALKCDSPESFAFWISNYDVAPLYRECIGPTKVEKDNTIYSAIENNFIIIASVTDDLSERMAMSDRDTAYSPDHFFDISSAVEDYTIKSFTDNINEKSLRTWHTYDSKNLICNGKSTTDGITTYTCETTLYASSYNSRIVIYTGADGAGFWVANLNKNNVSTQVTIELNDNVKISLTINRTTDISKSYKDAE